MTFDSMIHVITRDWIEEVLGTSKEPTARLGNWVGKQELLSSSSSVIALPLTPIFSRTLSQASMCCKILS
jgi:hypothetical protein